MLRSEEFSFPYDDVVAILANEGIEIHNISGVSVVIRHNDVEVFHVPLRNTEFVVRVELPQAEAAHETIPIHQLVAERSLFCQQDQNHQSPRAKH